MKMMYVTDLHGSEWKYDRVYEKAVEHNVDLVVNGGDMLPKSRRPINQGTFLRKCLDKHLKNLSNEGIHFAGFLGNDDFRIFDDLFDTICKKYPNVHNIAQRKVKIDDYEFIGMNLVVDYPFRLKDRCRIDKEGFEFQKQFGTALLSTQYGWKELKNWFSYAQSLPSIEDELKMLEKPSNQDNTIYVIHMPPANLGLDKCMNGSHVGSKAIYEFIKQKQPKFSLHGHIHESPETSGKWFNVVGKTTCIQPGQMDKLSYAIIETKEMEINRFIVD